MKKAALLFFLLSCFLSSESQTILNSKYGVSIPGKFYSRGLFIFVNLIYDIHEEFDPYYGINTPYWPAGDTTEGINFVTGPTYFLDYCDTGFSQNPHGLCSRIFSESSFGEHKFAGDYIVVNVKLSSIVPSDTIYNVPNFNSLLTSYATNLINSDTILQTRYGHNSSSDFDFWTLNSSSGVPKIEAPNDKFDFVVFLFRNTGYGERIVGQDTISYYFGYNSGQGSSGGSAFYFGSTHTDKGCTQAVGVADLSHSYKNIVIHEYAHFLFGSNAFHTSGGSHDGTEPLNYPQMGFQGGYGLMGGYNAGLITCNGYERWRMNWLDSTYNITNTTIAASNTVSDIDKNSGNKTFYLRDFITTGDVVRIKLPYKSNGAHDQYLWIENHKIGMNNKLDFIQYAGNLVSDSGRAGIYMYIQIGRDIIESTSSWDIYPSYPCDNLIIITGEGNYDYEYISDTARMNGLNNEPKFRKEKIGLVNSLSGANDQTTHFYSLNDTLTRFDGSYPEIVVKNNIEYNLPYLGDNFDAFLDSDSLCIATNPTPFNISTNYTYRNQYNFSQPERLYQCENIFLSGLKIKYTELINHDFKVDISWDEYDINRNTRWCGPIVLKEQLYINSGDTLFLDQSKTAVKIVRDTITHEFAPATEFTLDSLSYMEVSGTVVLKNYSKLLVNRGCTLKVKDNAKIIIEESASLVYNGGAIILEGNNSIIEFKGNLQIADNTTFTFTGNGYLKFSNTNYPSYNIVPGTNSKIWLNGSGASDKILEISQETMYAHGLAEFKFTNGIAQLHADSRLSVDGPIVMGNATITSNTSSYNAHRGLALFGQSGVSITSSTFKYGKYGIYAILTYGGYGLTINSSFFESNDYGLVTVDKYANLVECSFDYNSFGWQAIGMTQSSTASICYFQYNLQGIKYEFSATSGLLLNTTRVKYNEFLGMECYGPGTLTLNCSNVSFNDYSGVLLHHGASLNMSPSQSPVGRRSGIQDNYNSIITEDPANPTSSNNYMNYLYLSGGYNILVPDAGTMAVVGKIKGYTCTTTTLVENNNKWNTANTAPVWNVDYKTYNANCSKPGVTMSLTDNAPGYQSCGSGGGSISSLNNTNLNQPEENLPNDDALEITSTAYNNVPLQTATKNATDYITGYDGLGDDNKALNRLNQILNYLLDNSSDYHSGGIFNILHYANEAVAGMYKDSNVLSTVTTNSNIIALLNLYDRLISEFNPADSSEYLTWYELGLGKAHIFQTMGQYENALAQIDAIINFCAEDQVSVLNRQYCLISNERDLRNRTITPDEFVAVIELCSVQQKSMRSTSNNVQSSEEKTVKTFIVFPNPASEIVSFLLPETGPCKIRVLNVSGVETVVENCISNGIITIDISTLPQGVYFIEASGNSKYKGKFVKE
ncbi:MAG: T9SS type A sorting domain-containing protein [Bacteroidales bacterium]